ncbi:small ribosomal subunit protein eS10B-like [Anopheles ziemanni]|uniref:small ribosomal subunit protein eS10B-like n=1 Tax=Anopheles coustani TaxID=139045 RepID=UPI00265ABCFD|nr:small ribosomal subunit protein eS10B-like [Anopheles coustani]XP_058169047.1 small ribosomal subunit protein eS10B-like [Anopheles ziemanni]
MFMPKEHRVTIYIHLFVEGVLVIKKNHKRDETHLELATIPNVHIIKTMQSLQSKRYVKEKFVWNHYYWFLTEEGITFLRDVLHLPPNALPKTLMKSPTVCGLLQRSNCGLKYSNVGDIDKLEYRGGFGKFNSSGLRSLQKPKEMPAIKDNDKLEYRRGYGYSNNRK